MATNQAPEHQEVDEQFLKLTIGATAIALPFVALALSAWPLHSISASYYEGEWARNFLVGALVAISALLLSYDGHTNAQLLLAKAAALAAPGIAFFPCQCATHHPVVPYVHEVCAAIMFSILACFCHIFWKRALGKGHKEAMRRVVIYRLCFTIIIVAMGGVVLDAVLQHRWSEAGRSYLFWCEAFGLWAFGLSWLTASKWITWTADGKEEFKLFSPRKPAVRKH
mgnify:CR=1 FL=1